MTTPIGNNPAFLGFSFLAPGAVLDRRGAFGLLTTTNALRLTLGD